MFKGCSLKETFMIRNYSCEVCGLSSENEEAVRQCEELGSKAKYSVGQRVTFLYKPHRDRLEITGEITNIHFEEKTHKVSYTIFVEEDKRLGLRSHRSTHPEISENYVLGLADSE